MTRLSLILASWLLCAASAPVRADATLQSSLQLSPAQARQTDAIEARYRRAMASVRQDYNRESRALRRARLAHDEAEAARLEGLTDALRQRMVALRSATDDEIRGVLEPAQQGLFDAHLAQRRAMHGSARDERLLEDPR
jgi:Spy/CpxP family protein refolding chaperone